MSTIYGHITVDCVAAEVARLREGWRELASGGSGERPEAWGGELDPFDRVQLNFVIQTCRASKTLSEAGRKLFAVSRAKRSVTNDADRLKKYLARFKLSWEQIQRSIHGAPRAILSKPGRFTQ